MHYFETGHWVSMILCQKHVSEENKLHSLSYTWPYIHVTCIIMVFLFSFKYLDNISLNIYTLLITITLLFYIINEIQWYTALNFFFKVYTCPVKDSHVRYSLALIYYPVTNHFQFQCELCFTLWNTYFLNAHTLY